METYLDTYILNGGPMMFVLVPCSVVLVWAMVQAMIRLRRQRVLPAEIMERATQSATAGGRAKFAQGIRNHGSPLARVLLLTLKELNIRSDGPPQRQHLEPIVEEAVAHVADDLYDETGMLSTIYTIAPLLGLLGTILGMMRAFQEFAQEVQKDLTALSGGIQQALVTTLWGLGIAIVAYVAAQVFQSRIRDYERNGLPDKVLEIIAALFGRTAPEAPAPAQGAAATPPSIPATPSPPAIPSQSVPGSSEPSGGL